MNERLEHLITLLNECKAIVSREHTCELAAAKLDEAVWSIVSAQCELDEQDDRVLAMEDTCN